MTRLNFRIELIAMAVVALTVFSYQSSSAQIAIVVNKANSLDNVSLESLKKIYIGKITVFPGGEQIVPAECANLRSSFYQRLLDWTPRRVKEQWLRIVFSGGSAIPPVSLKNADDVRNFVSRTSGAICFLKLSDIDGTMKVLAVDALNPLDKGYPLK